MKITLSQFSLSFVFLFVSLPTAALEVGFYYQGDTYTTLEQAEAAMKVVHENDFLNPRVDNFRQYNQVYDSAAGKATYYYKIDLQDEIDANIDEEYWSKYGWPTLTSEADAIAMFLDWRTSSPAPSYHCEHPTFDYWESGSEFFDTSRPSWLSEEYPPELNKFKLFFGRVTNVGHYTEHGRLAEIGGPPETIISRVSCDREDGWPSDFESAVPGPSKLTVYICPEGYKRLSESPPRGCSLVQVYDTIESDVGFYLTFKPDICEVKEANPCSVATGNKTQIETDYILKAGGLSVQRHYSSQGLGDGYAGMGLRWRHNYSQRMDGYGAPSYTDYPDIKSSLYASPQSACLSGWDEIKSQIFSGLMSDATAVYLNGICEIEQSSTIVARLSINNTFSSSKDIGSTTGIREITRGNGQSYAFVDQDGSWQPLHPGRSVLTQGESSWVYRATSGAVETYDTDGKLLSSRNTNGQTTTFAYDDQGRLDRVTGSFDDVLTYHYGEDGRLIRITTPEGDLNYGYDAEGRLNHVTYLDGSERHYHYEDPNRAYLLTGITDENGDRFATWAYDDAGRATLSEHAGGAEQTTFRYNTDGTTTVTDAAGAERTYHFIVKEGGMKVDHVEGDRCTTCSHGGNKVYTYDGNGFISSKTDWNGNVTTYTRDSGGRELSRTEATGTPEARTVTTTWDSTLNKPLVITEPERITEFTYDSDGRLLSKQQRTPPQ
jgi:YD repeat-containing protein